MSPADRGRRGLATTSGSTSLLRSKETARSSSSMSPDSPSRRSRKDKPVSTEPGLAPPRVRLHSISPSNVRSLAPVLGRASSRGSQIDTTTNAVQSLPQRSHSGSNNSNVHLRALAAAATITESSRDKDVRIASLERELASVEAEHARELDTLSTTESESAAFWRAKHAALNQQFLRMDTELRSLHDEMIRSGKEHSDAVLVKNGGSGGSCVVEDGKTNSTATTNTTRKWQDNTMQNELARKDEEIYQLRAQVRGLKEWVSTSTRAGGIAATSDEIFSDGWAKLGNGLQNWVLSNYRRVKIVEDLVRIGDEAARREINELVPMYKELARTAAKVHLLQSIAATILMQRIFSVYFVGLSAAQEEHLRQTEKLMASFGAEESINQWRSITLSILKKEAAERMRTQTEQTVDDVVSSIYYMLDAITVPSAIITTDATAPSSESKDQALRHLVCNAVELSRLLVVQKAGMEVFMPRILPHQQMLFDQVIMEDVGGEDEEQLVQRGIFCVTFPGIIKHGDENGAQLQFRNVISKARVLCSPQ